MPKINLKYIAHLLGIILVLESVFMATSLFFVTEDRLYSPIAISSLITLMTGAVLYFSSRKGLSLSIRAKEGYLIVTLSWIVMSLFGTLPFLISGSIPRFIDALFETVSGFSTTGASILTDIEALPKSILYWRSMTHWIGGMGIIVLIVAILPALNVGGYQIYLSETSGFQSEKLHPRIAGTAKRLWGLYVAITISLVALLMAGGMNFFESVCHAFGAVATGGFSPKNTSIAGYPPYIQYIIMFFMLVSGINFVLLYALIKGKIRRFLTNQELRLYLFIIFISGVSIALMLYFKVGFPIERSFRESFFQVISIITATGYTTADYLSWPVPAWMLIFALMFVGACAGSTGGGVKVVRHLVFFKMILVNIKTMLHPNGIFPLRLNQKPIHEGIIGSVLNFLLIYILIFVVGSLLLSAMGIDMETSMGAMATTMGGIGPGLGTVGPASNFAHMPVLAKILLIFSMLLGRLELYTFLIVLTPYFWRD